MILTKEHLRAIAPIANEKIITALAPAVNYWFPIYGMADKRVAAMALGQWAEETDGFKTFREYASGAAYQGRMGNVNPGDGVKFAGMGPDMLTGRDNDTRIAKETGLDLVNHPELLLNADEGVHASCQFWVDNGLIPLALAGNEHEVTHRINGGFNGEAVRIGYIHRAQLIITEDLDIPAHVASLGTAQPKPPAITSSPIGIAPLAPRAAAPVPISAVSAPMATPIAKTPVAPLKPPAIGFWAWLLSFFRPAPVGNRQISLFSGDTTMTTAVTAPTPTVKTTSFLNTLNIVSLLSAFGGLTALLPKILTEFGTAGLIAAAAMVVGILVQALIPAGTAVAVENTLADTVLPAIAAIDPALKVALDQVARGLHDAAAATTANTAATVASANAVVDNTTVTAANTTVTKAAAGA